METTSLAASAEIRMRLGAYDWVVIAVYLAVTLAAGIYFRRRANNVADYFVAGRSVSWWLAGTSMVATTFAADTPLVVTGLVYSHGIAGNWLWWSFLPSGMLTVFLFARLWVRSGLLTDLEFIEQRYSGKPASFLRGFRALYLGLLINCAILGWVTKAMTVIISLTLGLDERHALLVCVFFLFPFTGLYVALGGLWGVLWTDLAQFVLKMGVVIAVAWYGVRAAGGLHELMAHLETMRVAAIAAAPATANPPAHITAFFPDFSQGLTSAAIWTIPVLTFLCYLTIQWWAVWYPGAEPGGGGYVAQRILSARDERNGILAVLWFNIAHYALRSWPWIMAALAVAALYPHLARPEAGYLLLALDTLPISLRGLLVAGFLAAFMSTLATHLNWGSSYLVTDFYRRFIRPNGPEKHYVHIARWATVLLVVVAAWVSWELSTIRAGWEFVLEVGAGTGGVYLLRWYWWRVNAWSEIAAMTSALIVSLGLRMATPFRGSEPLVFAKTALATTVVTTAVWVAVTLLTPAEPREVLLKWYRRVHPDALGWQPVAHFAPEIEPAHGLARNLRYWIFGCVMLYSAMFGVGKLCLGEGKSGGALLAVAFVAAWLLSPVFRMEPKAGSAGAATNRTASTISSAPRSSGPD
jgi:SSS family solute:Na+ symporter